MATYDMLPQTTYRPPTIFESRERRRSLRTIEEEDEESKRGSLIHSEVMSDQKRPPAWHTSLQTSQFPTPRGQHFLATPILATSPSDSETSSSLPPSEPWTKTSDSTDDTDFDDLYDVSSEDEDNCAKERLRVKRSSVASSTASRQSLPPLTIPATPAMDHWAEVEAFKALTSPVKALKSPIPPTPPPKIPHSPAIFSLMRQAQAIPSISAPPSLDGSLGSDQLAQLSAPPTPDVGYDSDDSHNGWDGVRLQPAAMATLQALAGESAYDMTQDESDQVIELPHQSLPVLPREMQEQPERRVPTSDLVHRPSMTLSLTQLQSLNLLTRLDIPSPGSFFGSLNTIARHSWHMGPVTPRSPRGLQPPSSTTAENFYNTPWTSLPPDHASVLSQPKSALASRPDPPRHNSSEETIVPPKSPPCQTKYTDPEEEPDVCDELIPDEFITRKTIQVTKVDLTTLWLAAQYEYISELINPREQRDDEVAILQRAASVKKPRETAFEETSPEPKKKLVRFSEALVVACPLPEIVQESTYYRAFTLFIRRTQATDSFSHRTPRYEAMQSQRVTFPEQHRKQLLGIYQLNVLPSPADRRMSANVARGDDHVAHDPARVKREKIAEASEQMSASLWIVAAIKALNGGRLFNAPLTAHLARLSRLGPRMSGIPRDRMRILDLGGQPTCDWGWLCAREYPNSKIYTVTTKALRQLSNCNIRGPANHRQISVQKLTRVPFRNDQFDLVSAREIYSILRESGEYGIDEWDACLQECMRILKPGGYLDFSIMDSDIVNAGPLGNAKAVEFGFNLKRMGYDPLPTKQWLTRLQRNGFVGIKRAWILLPMGPKRQNLEHTSRDSTGQPITLTMQAMLQGSTDDAATMTGLVGGWSWERWMLRSRGLGIGDVDTLDGVRDVLEEGRTRGAGWRMMNGWARKPYG